MRPEFNYRNWGMGFDFYLYIDANGKLYDETWKFNTVKNAYRTILDKFRYIRYGYPGDQLYFRVGSLTNITIGNGILVSNYSNAMEYPEEKKIGLQLGKNFPKGIGFDLTISDFRKTPGLASMTLNYPISPKFNIGVSYVTDINQTGALDDSDDDQVPDFIDDFPNDSDFSIDTDGDGLADELDFDADGDGFGLDASAETSCELPTDSVLQGGDCDDGNPAANNDTANIRGNVRLSSTKDFLVNQANSTEYFTSGINAAPYLDVSTVNVSTRIGSTDSLAIIDGAIAKVSGMRGSLGTLQNRLDYTVSNLLKVTEFTIGARSRIQDADFAAETSRLAKAQVLQQASAAMLSQANASTDTVLQLLRG